jgi:HlyD family secretion protein
VKVEIAKKSDTLRVPNAALRFRPSTDIFAALNQPVPPEAMNAGGRGRGGQGRGGNRNGSDATTPAPASPAPAASGTPPAAATPPATGAAPAEGAAAAGERTGGGGRGFDPARMMERFKGMSPDEQKQFIARLKDRGQDTSAFEKVLQATEKAPAKGAKTPAQSAQTIDALFAPLPSVESRGRAWLYIDHQLKPVNLRLGISDGTNTELLSGELQQNMEVVTGITGLTPTRTTAGPGNGNPLMPAGRGGPPGGGRGR